MEHSFPFTAPIVSIKTTKCNSLVALALKNNNVVVFDLAAGIINTF